MERTLYWMWLAEGVGSGCRTAGELLARWPDPCALYSALHSGRAAAPLTRRARSALSALEPERMIERQRRCETLGVFLLTPDSAAYPERLRGLPDRPLVLYGTGNPDCLNGRRYVGMVGTRRPTQYGRAACHDISLELARQGAVIVSGLAEGLDGAAHRAAVEAGQQTIAFLGTAINHTFPAANAGLRADIERLGGAVLSEYPPDYAGRMTGTFLARNRLIAGMSEALCVIEARQHSGSANTVGHAERYNRPVLAVPGSIYSPTSGGTNALLAERRAGVLRSADDVLKLLNMTPGNQALARPAPDTADLSPAARAVLRCLGPRAQSIDECAAVSGLPINEVSAALMELELGGLAADEGGGRYTAL